MPVTYLLKSIPATCSATATVGVTDLSSAMSEASVYFQRGVNEAVVQQTATMFTVKLIKNK